MSNIQRPFKRGLQKTADNFRAYDLMAISEQKFNDIMSERQNIPLVPPPSRVPASEAERAEFEQIGRLLVPAELKIERELTGINNKLRLLEDINDTFGFLPHERKQYDELLKKKNEVKNIKMKEYEKERGEKLRQIFGEDNLSRIRKLEQLERAKARLGILNSKDINLIERSETALRQLLKLINDIDKKKPTKLRIKKKMDLFKQIEEVFKKLDRSNLLLSDEDLYNKVIKKVKDDRHLEPDDKFNIIQAIILTPEQKFPRLKAYKNLSPLVDEDDDEGGCVCGGMASDLGAFGKVSPEGDIKPWFFKRDMIKERGGLPWYQLQNGVRNF